MSAAMCCDNCGAFAAAASDVGNRPYQPYTRLPVGWLRIFVHDQQVSDESQQASLVGEVCSRRCGSAWLEKA